MKIRYVVDVDCKEYETLHDLIVGEKLDGYGLTNNSFLEKSIDIFKEGLEEIFYDPNEEILNISAEFIE